MQHSNEELTSMIQAGERDFLPLLWEQIQAFVRQQANRWARAWQRGRPDVTSDDLYQTGYIALCEAVETFQASKESSFINWLSFYLKREFVREIGVRTYKQQQDPLNLAVSLDAPAGGDTEDLTLGDTIADPADQHAATEEEIWRKQCQAVISEALEDLTNNQREVLQARFWDELTLKEAGERLGSSSQNVQRWEKQGLRALRRSEYMAALRELWYGERNLYRGTTLSAWKNTGCSIQEATMIEQERDSDNWRRHAKIDAGIAWDSRIQFYVDELGYDPDAAQFAFGTDSWRAHT